MILTIFRGQIGVKVGPKSQILGTPCLCKNPSFSKCTLREKFSNTEFFLVRVFLFSDWTRKSLYLDTCHAMALNGICATMKTTCGQNVSLIWRYSLKLLPPKWVQLDPEPKKRSCFFWIKSKAANTQLLKLGIQKV